jgi:HSP20 family protein
MKKEHVWAALAVLFALALAFETGYLWKMKSAVRPAAERPREERAASQTRPYTTLLWDRPDGAETWDPFREMDRMHRLMNQMFRDSFSRGLVSRGATGSPFMSYEPDLDMQESATEYVYRIDLPGIEKDKVNIKVHNNYLTLSGERKTEKEASEDESGIYRMERSFGSFMRTVPLPPDANSEGMAAESKDGVLTIRIPKLSGVK